MDSAWWGKTLKAHLRTGALLDLVPAGQEPDPVDADQWADDRRIPADTLRDVLLWAVRHPAKIDPHGLRVRGAHVTGLLDLANMDIPCPIELADCRLSDDISLAATTLPTLSLRGSRIGGGTSTDADRSALTLDAAHITGDVLLNEGFTAQGKIRAIGATIGGELNLGGATLTNPGADALTLDRTRVTGSVFMHKGFTADGKIRAIGATIGGQLNLRGATLTNPEAEALTLQASHITGLVLLDDCVNITGTVNLASSHIETLVCPTEGCPPGSLFANGWHVRFIHGQVGSDAKTAQTWLDRPKDQSSSPQPGRELADILDRAGHPDQARTMRYNAAQEVAKQSKGWTRFRLTAYNLLAGHGYYPHRVIGWLFGIVVVAATVACTQPQLFEPTDYLKAKAATETAAEQSKASAPEQLTGDTPCPELGAYPCFPPMIYALQTVMPPATAVTTTAWQPAATPTLALFTVLKGASWILAVLFLGTITGLLKKT